MFNSLIEYWPGHHFGDCFVSPDSLFYWVNIPKNASSTLKSIFDEKLHWIKLNYHHCPFVKKATAIVVLRDPYERWITGIVEYMIREPQIMVNFFNSRKLVTSTLCSKVVFDEHTEQQLRFINDVNLSSAVFFYVDSQFKINFSKYFSSLSKVDPELDHINTTAQDTLKVFLHKAILDELDSNPEFVEQIKKYYVQDYELINQVKFYVPET